MSPAAVSLSAAKSSRLAASLGPLFAVYEYATLLDAMVLLTIAEQKDVSPTEVAEAYGLPLPRLMKTLYSLEAGRGDNDKKALRLIEIHANRTPGQRHTRMLRLSPKGEKVVSEMLAEGG